MSKMRLLGFSGAMVLSALIGGTVLSAVAAAPPATTAEGSAVTPLAAPTAAPAAERAPSPYCTAFRAAFAKELGVTDDQLTAAAKAAIGTIIDQAVADGKLSADAATKLKARVTAAEGDGCRLLGGWRGKVAGAALAVGQDAMAAAADALDMTVAEVRAQLRDGKTLKEVATAKGVPYETVTAAALAAVKADLDKAVAAGTIRQARADRILARVQERLENGWPRRAGAGQGAGQGLGQ